MEPYIPSKTNRRRVIGATLLFCALNIAYIVWRGGSDQTHVAALYSLSALAGSIVMFYINGSSKDTASYNETLVRLKQGPSA